MGKRYKAKNPHKELDIVEPVPPYHAATYQEIADELGVSKPYVIHLEKIALRKLKQMMATRGFYDRSKV